jgi:tetratricopeptide (TPR) repeat protein
MTRSTFSREFMPAFSVRTFITAAAMVLFVVAAWWVYAPGLSGAFLFDDNVNLPALGDYGPVDNWRTFLFYLTSGNADPTGRPLSLLSFLLDAQDWPADPEAFKRTNILLHVFNGVLLTWLLLELGRALGFNEDRTEKAAVLGGAIWLLHPLWISTTLYIVQREAMLPATFTLAGLIAYTRGRRQSASPVWLLSSLCLFTTLAFLSKANGLLLPTLAFVVDTIVRSAPNGRYSRKAPLPVDVFTVTVTFAIAAYLVYIGAQCLLRDISAQRPWTEWQRLITEPRVLCDYLGLLIFPHPYSRGLFNDSFPVSTSVFQPWTTLVAAAVIMALIVSAIRGRKRYPSISLAICFYFAGHVMESTTVPLELYFEHRNYLPAMLLFWPVSLWLTDSRGPLHYVRPALALGLLILLGTETRIAATLWGDPSTQAIVWAAQNSDSPRAQANAAIIERSVGRLPQAEARLRRALAARPLEIQLTINLLGVRCEQGSIAPVDFEAAKRSLVDGNNTGPLSFDWISRAIDLARDNACTGLTLPQVGELIDAQRVNHRALANPRFRQDSLDLQAQLALASANNDLAAAKFMEALRIDPRPDVALRQAALLASAGIPQAGLEELDYYSHVEKQAGEAPVHDMQTLHRYLLRRDGFWTREVDHLRGTLQADLDAQRDGAR